MNSGLIIGGGKFPEKIDIKSISKESDIIIAVDRGYEFLYKNNIEPTYVLGDFDSISNNFNIEVSPDKIIKYSSEKSMTDLDIAIEKIITLGLESVTILGATGTRLDHTFINILLLKKLVDNNILGKIIDDNNEIIIIKEQYKVFQNKYKYLSIIPLFEDTILSIDGVKYPLNNEKIVFPSSLCISNEILYEEANIITNDYAVLFLSND